MGYNFRISEIQAALGVSQLRRLKRFVKIRNSLANIYKIRLSQLPLKFQEILPNSISSYHLFTIEIVDINYSRDALYSYLKKNKIGCQVHYIPVHLHPFYKKLGFSRGTNPNSETYYKRCLSIPLHQGLTEFDIDFVIKKIVTFFKSN